MSETRYRSKPGAYRSKHERKTTKIITLGAGIALFIATVVFAAVVIPLYKTNYIARLPSYSPGPAVSVGSAVSAAPAVSETPVYIKELSPPAAPPLIYENAGNVFLANGGSRIKLSERGKLYGCYQSVNCVFSGDNRYFYYILGLDMNTGEGTLMAADANGASPAEEIAGRVCWANVSYDGQKVMYVTEVADSAGTLYLKDGKETERIANNAVPGYCMFSYCGEYISYIVRENKETFAMYAKKSGNEPELVTRITAAAITDNGLSLTRFSEAAPLGSGQVVYSIEENYNMPLYLYTLGGGAERLCNDGYIVKVFTSGGFLYAETGREARPLWYKAPGKEPVLVSENYDYIKFLRDDPIGESRFLLVEHIGEGAENPGVMMYEAQPGAGKCAISLAENEGFEINRDFDCVAYERGGKLYVSRKTEAGWKEAYLSKASRVEFQGAYSSGITARFDASGKNLYYFDKYKTGPLFRYCVQDGKTSRIVENVDWFRILGDIPYAHTTRDKLYRGADKPRMILEGVREIRETQGGAYLLTGDGKVCFIADGEDRVRNLDSYSKTAALSDSIRYYPALGEDAGAAIEVLSREINYCLYKLGVFRNRHAQPLGVDEAAAITEKLLGREDLDAADRTVLKKMRAGFEAYTLWARGKGKRSTAAAALDKAAESYSKYIAGALTVQE